jgi:ketosteroid isomerase-like protein
MIKQGSPQKSGRARQLGIVSKFVQIRTSARFEDWSDLVANDISYAIPGDRNSCPLCGTFVGMQELAAGFENLHVTFEIIGQLEIVACLTDGNCVVLRLTSPWRSRGSGRSIHHESFNFFYFEQNVIKRASTFFDTAILAEFSGEEWTPNRERYAPLVGLPRSVLSGYESKLDLGAFTKSGPNSKSSRTAKKDIAEKLAQARACGRIETIDQLLADDIVFRLSGDPTLLRVCGNYVGKAGVREAFRNLRMTWEHVKDEIWGDVLIDDDQIAFRQLSRWRSRGSGITVNFETANYIQLKEGRIREYILFVDTAALARSIE